jgi:hypothetical protein
MRRECRWNNLHFYYFYDKINMNKALTVENFTIKNILLY